MDVRVLEGEWVGGIGGGVGFDLARAKERSLFSNVHSK